MIHLVDSPSLWSECFHGGLRTPNSMLRMTKFERSIIAPNLLQDCWRNNHVVRDKKLKLTSIPFKIKINDMLPSLFSIGENLSY